MPKSSLHKFPFEMSLPPTAWHSVISIQLLSFLRWIFIIRYTQWHMAMINKTVRTHNGQGSSVLFYFNRIEITITANTFFLGKWHLCANVECIFTTFCVHEHILKRFWKVLVKRFFIKLKLIRNVIILKRFWTSCGARERNNIKREKWLMEAQFNLKKWIALQSTHVTVIIYFCSLIKKL